jgi:RNA polymerase sigma factor (sigma-70 family)
MHKDTHYIQSLLNNDFKGISEIYRMFAPQVERWVCANNGSADDARDIFQEALLVISRQARRESFVLTCPFGAYLHMVCRGKWLNEIKRKKRQAVTIEQFSGFPLDQDASTLAEQTLKEARRDEVFKTYFEKLPDGCKKIIQLSWTGISMETLSQELGISYGYARKRKAECIAQLIQSIRSSIDYTDIK